MFARSVRGVTEVEDARSFAARWRELRQISRRWCGE